MQDLKPFVTRGIIGNANDLETLDKLGVRKADGVIVSLGEKVDYGIIAWVPTKSFIGKTIGELDLRNKYGVQIVSVEETVPDRLTQLSSRPIITPDWYPQRQNRPS